MRELSHFTREHLQSGAQIKERKTSDTKLPELQKAEESRALLCSFILNDHWGQDESQTKEGTRENIADTLKTVLTKTSAQAYRSFDFVTVCAKSSPEVDEGV